MFKLQGITGSNVIHVLHSFKCWRPPVSPFPWVLYWMHALVPRTSAQLYKRDNSSNEKILAVFISNVNLALSGCLSCTKTADIYSIYKFHYLWRHQSSRIVANDDFTTVHFSGVARKYVKMIKFDKFYLRSLIISLFWLHFEVAWVCFILKFMEPFEGSYNGYWLWLVTIVVLSNGALQCSINCKLQAQTISGSNKQIRAPFLPNPICKRWFIAPSELGITFFTLVKGHQVFAVTCVLKSVTC